VADTLFDGSVSLAPVADRDREGLPAAFVVGAVVFAILLTVAVTLGLLASLQPS
jgi:hypothetical protein